MGRAPSSRFLAALSLMVPSVSILVSAAPPSGVLWKRPHDLVPDSWWVPGSSGFCAPRGQKEEWR